MKNISIKQICFFVTEWPNYNNKAEIIQFPKSLDEFIMFNEDIML